MITKDLKSYADINWSGYLKTLTELSRSGNNNPKSLIERDQKLYCFDDICSAIFPSGKIAESADAILITRKTVELIEFKTGFKKRITKENLDSEKAKCEQTNQICNEYWNLFFKNQDKDTKELIASIRNKAIESYVTLEKMILPECDNLQKGKNLKYIAVIDEDGVDAMENTLLNLSGGESKTNNSVSCLQNALRRLTGLKTHAGEIYYYDEVKVMSPQEFKYYLDNLT